MRIAMMVKGCVCTPAPADIIYSPMQLATQLARVWAGRGHHLDFYGPVGSEVPGARVIDCGVPPLVTDKDEFTEALTDPGLASDNILALWDARLAQEMFLRAGRGEYDVLYFHHPEVPLPFLAHHPGVPVVSSVYDSPLPPLLTQAIGMFASPQHRLVAISAAQRHADPNLTFAATIPGGVDTADFAPDPAAPPGRHLLFAGRLVPEKGVGDAIEVARLTGHELRLVGPWYSNSSYFADEIAPHLGDQVRYLGPLSLAELRAELRTRPRALLMPSRHESFGLIIIEALACGVPVIGLRRGAIPEIVIDGQTGFLVEDVDEMVAAVHRLPTIDSDACRADAVRRFSLDGMADAYEALFRQVGSA
ncbi:glycosyltransferase [Dactylosporangium roseum]|uniref:Glycosyltransferase n=1 Tax=Dactylosporangium roseum TaxID=47989 RepID=A0ABY5Z674_9ACTN|nr:glycosyltransferase [Dactylosporangium roseum]UWZ37081.1 glycosyltransferase [Dactylosporangium roseum]